MPRKAISNAKFSVLRSRSNTLEDLTISSKLGRSCKILQDTFDIALQGMKQSQALDILKAGKNVYLTGAAGSGKTHVLNEYIAYLKNHGVSVGVTASTGIAATHIGGVTIHSWSGVGIKNILSEQEIEGLEGKEYLWKRFDKTKVLVIDEVSMINSQLFDTVERVCRAMKRSDEPFGGMQVVLSGDFFQLPPISKGGTNSEFVASSEAWKAMDIRICYLEEQFRHKGTSLEDILNEIRSGTVSSEARALLDGCYEKKFDKGVTPTRLYTHNVDVDALNDRKLEELDGEEMTFEMKTGGKSSIVASLKKSVLAPEKLRLKRDAVVMFVKNNFNEGYVNGTLGVVDGFENGAPVIKTFSGRMVTAIPASWTVEEDGKILASVEQLPLRLAWAITVHKSQGMSMDAAEIDLSRAFVPGQGYVALSRLRTLDGLSLVGINDMGLSVHRDASELDGHLLKESIKWEGVIEDLSDDINRMHKEFIMRCGGTMDEEEIEKNMNKQKKVAVLEKRVPTHLVTLELVNKGLELGEIAKERGMVLGTIIAHLEKLRALDTEVDIERFKPKKADFDKIKKAFESAGDMKLASVRQKFGSRYSYEDLRLVRLFL